ncbi:MAG: ATP synthase F1 subunit gamma [Candidatus Doudnabacteria bacterium]
MANSKEIKRRIKSVTSIGQITKAMELVSAAKMRKAQVAATSSRPYATLSSQLLKNLAAKSDLSSNPLINRVLPDDQKIPVQKILAILVSSDRGLAGAFNANVIGKALDLLKENGSEKFDFITIGKKGADAIRRSGHNIVAAFPAKDKVSFTDSKAIAQIAIQDFLAFKYEKVFIIYTDFVSTLVQRPNILQLLPFSSEGEEIKQDLLFEPSPAEVLESLITRTVEFAVYQTLVEAAASEHSARMVAMRNANDAAADLIEDLSLSFNQARQAGITRELSEISAAKLAMEE